MAFYWLRSSNKLHAWEWFIPFLNQFLLPDWRGYCYGHSGQDGRDSDPSLCTGLALNGYNCWLFSSSPRFLKQNSTKPLAILYFALSEPFDNPELYTI